MWRGISYLFYARLQDPVGYKLHGPHHIEIGAFPLTTERWLGENIGGEKYGLRCCCSNYMHPSLPPPSGKTGFLCEKRIHFASPKSISSTPITLRSEQMDEWWHMERFDAVLWYLDHLSSYCATWFLRYVACTLEDPDFIEKQIGCLQIKSLKCPVSWDIKKIIIKKKM